MNHGAAAAAAAAETGKRGRRWGTSGEDRSAVAMAIVAGAWLQTQSHNAG